jgi:hypothetical protein
LSGKNPPPVGGPAGAAAFSGAAWAETRAGKRKTAKAAQTISAARRSQVFNRGVFTLQEYNRLGGSGTPVFVAAGYLNFPRAQKNLLEKLLK